MTVSTESADQTVGMSASTSGMARASGTPRRAGGFWAFYGRLWRRVPAEAGVLFVAFPLAVLGTAVLWPVFFTGVGMLVLIAGFFLVLAALYMARAYGNVTLALLEAAGQPRIPRPAWNRKVGTGYLGRVFGPFANGHYWLYLLDAMLVQIGLATVTWGILIAWVSTAFGGVTYWIWAPFIPRDGQTVWTSRVVWEWATHSNPTFDPILGDAVLYGVTGIVFLFTLPFVTRGLVSVHWVVARGFLGSWQTDRLRREVDELSLSRAAAVAAEDRELRRLERDIHDGPQQQLIRLRMDIAAAQRRLHDDPDATNRLLGEAGLRAQDALDELRALSRGFAPPILQDRGLAAALDSLASRSVVPVTVVNRLSKRAIPSEVERNLYFVAAELLTNVGKHANATSARLELTADGDQLVLTVEDDGNGGASETAGHGLAGIRERITAMRGTTQFTSGASGTTARICVPLS
ncbi:sensor histidine kinase [Rathayibacter sp. KR2-224]|uniref:sensor histidine kinase n=1 Tax=Rathayibacter sp. KR2-224 TaxID=3400913 RepID=UPI003C0E31B1